MQLGLSRRDFLKTSLSAAVAPSLLGCGLSPSETVNEVPDPRLSARPGIPTIMPTPGLSALGVEPGRDGIIYVPESYAPDSPAPLFIALHGAGGDADNWESYHARAETRGMILLAIDSRANTWDVLHGGIGPDVRFLDLALQHVFDRVRIDPTRIALGGFSDGASYALSIGVSNGDLLSHLIAYSPGFIQAVEPIVGKPRIYVSHGSNDSVLPSSLSENNIVPAFRADGYDVTFEPFDGGHTVPAEITESALDWFLL